MMRYMKDYTLLVKQCSSAFFYKSICFIACKTILDSNVKYTKYLRGGGGGYQAYLFGNINFEIAVAQQGPYMYQHFGEVSGPWRPTGSEPRPALIWATGIAIWLF